MGLTPSHKRLLHERACLIAREALAVLSVKTVMQYWHRRGSSAGPLELGPDITCGRGSRLTMFYRFVLTPWTAHRAPCRPSLSHAFMVLRHVVLSYNVSCAGLTLDYAQGGRG